MKKNLLIIFSAGSLVWMLSALAYEMSHAERLVHDYYSQFQKPGFFVDDLMHFYTEDIVFTDPTFEISVNGKSEVRKLYADLGTERTAYKNIQWAISSVISEDDRIVIRGKWSGRFHDCEFDIDFMTLWRIEDGKIAEQNDFFAASTFDRQVGWNGSVAACKKQLAP